MLTRSQTKKIAIAKTVLGKRKDAPDVRGEEHKTSLAVDVKKPNNLVERQFSSRHRIDRRDWSREGAIQTTITDVIKTGFFPKDDKDGNFAEGLFSIETTVTVLYDGEIYTSQKTTKKGDATRGVFQGIYTIKEEPVDYLRMDKVFPPTTLSYVDTRLGNRFVYFLYSECKIMRCVRDKHSEDEKDVYMKETSLTGQTVRYGKWNWHDFVGPIICLKIISAKERRVIVSRYTMEIHGEYKAYETVMAKEEFYHWFDDMVAMDAYNQKEKVYPSATALDWPEPPNPSSCSTTIDEFDGTIGVSATSNKSTGDDKALTTSHVSLVKQ